MKAAVAIVIVLVGVIIATILNFRGATDPVLIPPQGDVTLIDTRGPGHYTPRPPKEVVPGPAAGAAISWIGDHRAGWRLSFADYAPHVQVLSDTFMLDIQSDALVLNYARTKDRKHWVQIVRGLSHEEQLFWQDWIHTVKPPN